WKNPLDHTLHRIRVLGVDPERHTFLAPQFTSQVASLRAPDSILVDARCKEHVGRASPGDVTELTERNVHVIGTFSLGTDFKVDGTAIVSDRTFFNLFPDYRASDPQLSRVEIGLLRVTPGAALDRLVATLKRVLPADVVCMPRSKFVKLERDYWMRQ